jgi:hypothetical protein
MPSAHAHIPTERAGRYLAQLCRHLDQMARMPHRPPGRPNGHGPPTVESVDWSDTSGTISFSQGTCSVRATSDTLTVRVDADDQDSLRRLQAGIARRLDTIGRRDHLSVHWQPPDSTPSVTSAEATPEPTPEATGAATSVRRAHRRGRALIAVGVAALAVFVHVGLLGDALARSPWTSWGTNIILAVIAVKAVVAGVHLVLGRVALRGLRKRVPWPRGRSAP